MSKGRHSERRSRKTQRARERFPVDDPLRYQHALRGDRLTTDEEQPEPNDIDLNWYRENPGEMVDPSEIV